MDKGSKPEENLTGNREHLFQVARKFSIKRHPGWRLQTWQTLLDGQWGDLDLDRAELTEMQSGTKGIQRECMESVR